MSRLEWDNREERYEIRNVIGADGPRVCEQQCFHESDGSVASGKHSMTGFAKRSPTELPNWRRTANNFKAAIARQDSLLICGFLRSVNRTNEQYEGFLTWKISTWLIEPRTRSMQAILGIDGANKRQVLKQPDVLMLLYLMRQS